MRRRRLGPGVVARSRAGRRGARDGRRWRSARPPPRSIAAETQPVCAPLSASWTSCAPIASAGRALRRRRDQRERHRNRDVDARRARRRRGDRRPARPAPPASRSSSNFPPPACAASPLPIVTVLDALAGAHAPLEAEPAAPKARCVPLTTDRPSCSASSAGIIHSKVGADHRLRRARRDRARVRGERRHRPERPARPAIERRRRRQGRQGRGHRSPTLKRARPDRAEGCDASSSRRSTWRSSSRRAGSIARSTA